MFKVSVEGETLEELSGNLNRVAAMFRSEVINAEDDAAREKLQKTRSTGRKRMDTETPPGTADADPLGDDGPDEEPAEQPAGSKQVVDAGTGKPIATDDKPVKMTMDDVRAAAAKLAAKDSPKLAEILGNYGAAKLSEVPKAKLADFAGEVLAELG